MQDFNRSQGYNYIALDIKKFSLENNLIAVDKDGE